MLKIFSLRGPPGPRSGTPFRTDPPVGLEGSLPTRAAEYQERRLPEAPPARARAPSTCMA